MHYNQRSLAPTAAWGPALLILSRVQSLFTVKKPLRRRVEDSMTIACLGDCTFPHAILLKRSKSDTWQNKKFLSPRS